MLRWNVRPDVTRAQLEPIETGIGLARDYLADALGFDIPEERRRQIEISVSATGTAVHCCEAVEYRGDFRLIFDVLHPQWDRPAYSSDLRSPQEDRWKGAAHEYGHAWVFFGSCTTVGRWMAEGIGEYIGNQALIFAGVEDASEVRFLIERRARGAGETDVPLESLERTSLWPGHIGYLAMEWLIIQAPDGLESLANLCIGRKSSSASSEEVFENAFGISKADFYEVFSQETFYSN